MGRHSRKAPAKNVAALCIAGLALGGTALLAAYGSVGYLEPNQLPEGFGARDTQSATLYPPLADAPTIPTGPVPAPAPSLDPSQPLEKDQAPPTQDPTPTSSSPPEPTESATERPVPQDPPRPKVNPPRQDQKAAQGNSEPAPLPSDEAPNPRTDRVQQAPAVPPIVRALPNLLCLPFGAGLQRTAGLATADIVSEFDFSGTILGRGGRPGASDHPSGLASDFMTTNVALGNSIRDYALNNKQRLGIKYVIWRQRYYDKPGPGRLMDDRGSPTANHYDHVHISFVDSPGSAFAPRCG